MYCTRGLRPENYYLINIPNYYKYSCLHKLNGFLLSA